MQEIRQSDTEKVEDIRSALADVDVDIEEATVARGDGRNTTAHLRVRWR